MVLIAQSLQAGAVMVAYSVTVWVAPAGQLSRVMVVVTSAGQLSG
jgi:hypothetical protein